MENRKNTILMVDQDIQFINAVRSNLEPYYRFNCASAGGEVFKTIERKTPDLVLTEINLEGSNGLGLAANIKSNIKLSHIPIFFVSHTVNKSFITTGLKIADSYITKPIDADELALRVKSYFRHKANIQRKYHRDFLEKSHLDGIGDQYKGSSSATQFKEKVLIAIQENLENQELDIAKLCTFLHVSPSTLRRRIKQNFDTTPVQLILNQRLEKSLVLLERRDMSVSEVAYTCGFESLSYFSRCFRRRYKIPPTKFFQKICHTSN